MKGKVAMRGACLLAMLLAMSHMDSVRCATVEFGGGASAAAGKQKDKQDIEISAGDASSPGDTASEEGIASRSGGEDILDDGGDEQGASEKPINVDDVPICDGVPKFHCCDDQKFREEGGKTFCACTGVGNEIGCSYEVDKSSTPLIVTDLRALTKGQICRCKNSGEVPEETCFGRTKTSCCDKIEEGADECQCLTVGRCFYKKGKNGEWINKRFPSRSCACP